MNTRLSKAVAAAFTSATLLLPAFALAQTTGTTGGAAGGTSSAAPAGSGATTSSTAGRSADRGGDKNTLHRADRRFIEEAAESDLAEITTSRLAQQKAASDSVKKFAQHMLDDHMKTSDRLKTLAQSKGVQLPTEPEGAQKRVVSKLEKESAGAEFDREYINGQVSSHRKTVRLFERQAKDGRDPELKAFASETLPNLREHLKMVQDLQAGLSGKGSGRGGDRSAAGAGAGMGAGAGSMGTSGGMAGSTGSAGSTGGAGSPAGGAGSAGGASTTGR